MRQFNPQKANEWRTSSSLYLIHPNKGELLTQTQSCFFNEKRGGVGASLSDLLSLGGSAWQGRFCGTDKECWCIFLWVDIRFWARSKKMPPPHTRTHTHVTDTNETATLPHKAQSGISWHWHNCPPDYQHDGRQKYPSSQWRIAPQADHLETARPRPGLNMPSAISVLNLATVFSHIFANFEKAQGGWSCI